MTIKNKTFGTVGLIGRFKPLHNGAVLMLEAVCNQAEQVKIGIGSSNKYNLRNPFTADETEGMLRAYLSPRYDNFEIIHVPDFAQIPEYADGQQWRKYVRENFGALEGFVSGNDYVRDGFKNVEAGTNPVDIIPRESRLVMRATEVRIEMARNGSWKNLVPEEVADYLARNNLVERFHTEFGLQTLLQLTAEDETYRRTETGEEEKKHTLEM